MVRVLAIDLFASSLASRTSPRRTNWTLSYLAQQLVTNFQGFETSNFQQVQLVHLKPRASALLPVQMILKLLFVTPSVPISLC